MRAVRVNEFGDPSVLSCEEVPDPIVGDGQTLIEVDTAGVNFGDLLVRRGEYFGRKDLPVIPGWEVVGKASTPDPGGAFETGDRVVALLDGNGYAEKVVAPTPDVVPVPEGISDEVALAMVIQGATAWRLLDDLTAGDRLLVSGAGSGVTHLVVQLARLKGAGEIAVLASDELKADQVKALGADTAIRIDVEDPVEQIKAGLGGAKADLVIDMVGGDVFLAMLRSLGSGGRAVVYGVAGGTPAKVSTGAMLKNGWNISGLWLGHPGAIQLREVVGKLFELALEGRLKPTLGPSFPLEQAGAAHLAVEARSGVGKVTLEVRAD